MTKKKPDAEIGRIQQSYNRNAKIYDLQEWIVEWLFYRRWRELLWREIGKEVVLEVGVGTGKNLAYHPKDSQVVAIDFSTAMLARAMVRNARNVPLLIADVQYLPFTSGHFDTVVATFVFCSVPDAVLGLQEIQQVLCPGGTVLLLEHQRAKWPWLAKIMDWVNPLTVRLMGVNINRNTVQNVKAAGLNIKEVRELDPAGIFVLIRATK